MFIHCPKCNSIATVPIAYGKPGRDMEEAVKYGLIHLAGCVIDDAWIDRHCKACGAEWATNTEAVQHRDNGAEMFRMLDWLETELKDQQQSLERICIDMGRLGMNCENCSLENLIQTIHFHHEAWRDFTYRLQLNFGDRVVIKDPKGDVQADYDIATAHIYIKKQIGSLYSELGRLAIGCLRLGASSKGSADDMKRATVEIQLARDELSRNWQKIRQAALSYRD
jgi:hypothetical protein